MIDRQVLLKELKGVLKTLEADLRQRADERGEAPEIHAMLTAEYEEARKAERTAASFEEWRGEQITQKGVAWILSCVFARFLEDNGLVEPPRISGPGERLQRARDEHELYFRSHPAETDREYLLDVFSRIAALPAGKEIFGKHNAIHVFPGWLSGDAAGDLVGFFQKIDAKIGALVHDFTDDEWDTRFLGDLYQDLSEAARKKYALLQTPDFVEEFILDRTLEPALDEFGLHAPPVKNRAGDEITGPGFRMIDPACGPGHFLLGAFDRILARWMKAEPGTKDRELVVRTLASIHGVDLNPFAVAIAKFRLLLKAMQGFAVRRLADCPNFELNLACGDSLLHGEGFLHQEALPLDTEEKLTHRYQTEDYSALIRILRIGVYHAVVANPPYITVKDKAVNQACRRRYPDVCHMKYSLAMPFMHRMFLLACEGSYVGQITANSFTKREFGKKLIEGFLPKIDLTHVIDTSGAYIPGHGTPTVILFARNRKAIAPTIRSVLGIQGEPSTPENPEKGVVWAAILRQIDRPGSQGEFVSVNDTEREHLEKHPWSLGGGGATELKSFLNKEGIRTFNAEIESIGFMAISGEDEVFTGPSHFFRRYSIPSITFGIGESVRDHQIETDGKIAFMYETSSAQTRTLDFNDLGRFFEIAWITKTNLSNRLMFGKKPEESGLSWYEYRYISEDRLRASVLIVFAFVATHNHFILDRGGKVFNRSAPVIKLPKTSTIDDHLYLLGLLNSAVACFWMKQVFHNKGSSVDQRGARQRTMPFEDFWEHDGTKLKEFPIPPESPLRLAKKLDALATAVSEVFPSTTFSRITPTVEELSSSKLKVDLLTSQMIALQEELDWQCYDFYGLLPKAEIKSLISENPPELNLGQRAFEILMARKMAAGELETTWFQRHNSTPITELPDHWPEDYKQLVEKRIQTIEENPRTIGLIEKPEYKRRWNLEPWDKQLEKALWRWLLDRLESYFDFDGRMNEEETPTAKFDISLTTAARLADIARSDEGFMQVAELYRKRPDFDVTALVSVLVDAETVPLLPACRYKPSGLDKRTAWERTWDLQRLEDAVDALFDIQRLAETPAEKLTNHFGDDISTITSKISTLGLNRTDRKIDALPPSEWLAGKLNTAQTQVQKYKDQGTALDAKKVTDTITNISNSAKSKLIGDIPVPPKYTTKDFQNTTYWRLRGKLDVPKERWISFPHCEGEDQTLLIAWAGYDHLQLAQAIAAHYVEVQEKTGGSRDPRLEILLACLLELIPWLKQWHNDLDPEHNLRMGDYFEDFIQEEARQTNKSIEDIRGWQPPKRMNKKSKKSSR